MQGEGEPSHLFRLDLFEAVLTWVEKDTMIIDKWAPGEPVVRFTRADNDPVVRSVLQ